MLAVAISDGFVTLGCIRFSAVADSNYRHIPRRISRARNQRAQICLVLLSSFHLYWLRALI